MNSIFDSFNDFGKFTVGFEPVLVRLQEQMKNFQKDIKYPPYNVRKIDDNHYVVEIAVAGFGKQDINIEFQDGQLTITGNINSDTDDTSLLYKGIADRAFTRKFTLADTIQVQGADLVNGILKVWLENFIPEEKKARKIDIGSTEETVTKATLLQEGKK